MKSFNSEYLQKQPITHNLLQTIRRIAEYKGKQDLYKEQSPQILETLRQAAIMKRNLGKLDCLGRGPNAKWRNR